MTACCFVAVAARRYPERMPDQREFEFVFEPQDEGGYHVYAPDLPGLHTQGEDIDEATENAQEALALYVEGLQKKAARALGQHLVQYLVPDERARRWRSQLARRDGRCSR
jgi:predicted RNase H-like HicB family nuclease